MRTRTRTETCGRKSGVSKPLLLMLMRMPWRRRRTLRSCLQWRRSPPVAVPPNSQQPPFRSDRFFFFSSGGDESYFSIRKCSQIADVESGHIRGPEVKERLPSNAIFGRPGLVGVEEGVREASGRGGASHRRRRGGKKVCLHLGVRTAAILVTSGPHDDGAHPRCGNPDPWFHLFSRWCR